MTTIYINMRDSFYDEQLITEMEGRGYAVLPKAEADSDKEELNRIYEALYLGKQEEATRRMKEYVCNKVGRLL
jgi:hypothetical protein